MKTKETCTICRKPFECDHEMADTFLGAGELKLDNPHCSKCGYDAGACKDKHGSACPKCMAIGEELWNSGKVKLV